MARPIKIDRNFKLTKDGKVLRQFVARDASHAISAKKSKTQRVVRSTPKP